MAERRKAQSTLATQAPADPLAEVEATIVRLTELRQREPGKERRADYGAVIDRLHALAYRLTEAPSRVLGQAAVSARVPKAPAAAPAATTPEPRAKSPQAALPLGPAETIRRALDGSPSCGVSTRW